MSLVLKLCKDSPMADRGRDDGIFCDRTKPEGASRTQQSFAEDADINNIMKRYASTGGIVDLLNPDAARQPLYMDVSEIGDFQAVQMKLQAVNVAFASLPAAVREKFDNSPAKAIDFMAKPENLKEAVDLGLLPKELLPKEAAGPVVPPKEGAPAPVAPVTPTPVTPAS